MDATDDNRSPADEDATVEAAVLQHVLAFHPARASAAELIRELGGESPGFGERDAIERAIRDLTQAGLLHSGEGFVGPTRAALRFNELDR
jgi:hypothetical protein